MNRLDHVAELAKSSHQHIPALLSLFVGLFNMKRDSFLFIGEENPGDNIPVTLMDSIRR